MASGVAPVALQAVATPYSGTITLGGTAQDLCPPKSDVRGLAIQNQSTGALYLRGKGSAGTNVAAADQNSFRIDAGGYYEPSHIAPFGYSIFGATPARPSTARCGDVSTCRDLIRDAFLEIGALADGVEPDANEARLGVRRLNALIGDLMGVTIGAKLRDVALSASATLQPNTRALVSSSGGIVLTLPDAPGDGARVQVVDVGATFLASPVTITTPGRLLEGVPATLNAATNGFTRTWLYRSDLGGWIALGELAEGDDFPFPPETEDAFTTLLALRLSPTTGQAISAETQAVVTGAKARLRSRLRQRTSSPGEPAVLRLSVQSGGRAFYTPDSC